ncbi:nucleotide sugar dehydrogenase [Picosynechococcus sp. PCC 7003]|uniref:nucleotide sugar dehydrogenase n=1 Tax=Picosynechococcus sp. PCC 7003 TaxID=374981 RepID=UPI0008104617|nr:nucleotide sugar dehydrogenase [Picosynechococcus sp. PCC 7003]ANV84731.1 nucleotide sugar dehydrogenase [Picosynechococcus sp. PCC 7003]
MNKKIVVIGTGYVGLPAALMWAKSGATVVGVDINENVVRAINERTMLINEIELQQLMEEPQVRSNLVAQTHPASGDVFVIAVPTPVHPLKKVADITYVESAIKSICPYLKKGNLVIVESTIPPMTCRNTVKPIIEEITGLSVPNDILVAHCPERILPGNIFQEIIFNDRLIGGMNEESSQLASQIYSMFVKGNLYLTDDLTAELSKLMENTYRDVNIALANEFSMICEDLGVDAKNVINYANKHPRVNILNPGIGVGGHCIPVDPWFLKEIAPYNSRLITTARLINDEMPSRIASKIRHGVSNIDNPKIIALGATYKKNCEDIRESPALEVVKILKQDGYSIKHFDPLVPTMQYDNLMSALKNADLLVILVAHTILFQELENNQEQIKNLMRNYNILIFDQ